MSLLEVHDLKVHFATDDGVVKAVDGASFAVERGQTLGIVGESGCGKSVANMTILGLTRSPNTTISGRILLEGRDLNEMSADDLRGVRGREIAMIFQDPLTSLHPFYKVGKQLVEAMQAHQDVSKERGEGDGRPSCWGLVGIPDAERRLDDYPHEFSGGMRQRVMIAMALINDPKVLIADEPTTALDVTIQAQILALIERLQEQLGMAVILITHDLGVIAEIADSVNVMYAGRIVEAGTPRPDLLRPPAPLHLGPARLAGAARPPANVPASPQITGPAAVAARAAAGLPLPSPLPARVRRCTEVPALEVRGGRARPHRPLLALRLSASGRFASSTAAHRPRGAGGVTDAATSRSRRTRWQPRRRRAIAARGHATSSCTSRSRPGS